MATLAGAQAGRCRRALARLAGDSPRLQGVIRDYLEGDAQAPRPAPRALLADLLIANNAPLSEGLLAEIDEIMVLEGQQTAAAVREVTRDALGEDAAWYRHVGSPGDDSDGVNLVVFKGDIRGIRVDGMVNAANEEGLGCFIPSHRCIDNVLHRAAGPRLRESCRKALAAREKGCELLRPGTTPLVTPGHHLPCNHVLHVTGPCVPGGGRGRPTAEHTRQLQNCYRLCLDAAKEHDMKSIAFCCISTGLFGYPQDLAAATALSTVHEWLEEETNRAAALETIVFVTYLATDNAIYKDIMDRQRL
eukprot:g4761.t1